jgi:hypothetical protein
MVLVCFDPCLSHASPGATSYPTYLQSSSNAISHHQDSFNTRISQSRFHERQNRHYGVSRRQPRARLRALFRHGECLDAIVDDFIANTQQSGIAFAVSSPPS